MSSYFVASCFFACHTPQVLRLIGNGNVPVGASVSLNGCFSLGCNAMLFTADVTFDQNNNRELGSGASFRF